ncbi:hypothetical protein EI94DRAFT_1706799 [Lactarius quietus]|nr:hypothetical protein EI94DRAFT_1706799 [Lactarius quietus]
MEHMLGGSKKPPASFNPMALRSDAVSHVAPTAAYWHVANSTAIASRSNNALEPDYLVCTAGGEDDPLTEQQWPVSPLAALIDLLHYYYVSTHLSHRCRLFNFASYPTQWALVLSENPQFMGPGWGSSPAQTVNGLGTPWVWFERSPAGFHPSGLFLGIAYFGQVSISINNMKVLISGSNQASAEDLAYVQGTDDIPWGSDKYVVLALLRLYEGRYLRIPRLGRGSLAHFIAGRIRDLLRVPCTPGSNMYPIVSLDSGNVSYGHSAHTWRCPPRSSPLRDCLLILIYLIYMNY